MTEDQTKHVSCLIPTATPAYTTRYGAAYQGDSLQLLPHVPDSSISLVITSPPFALQREKEYGNRNQDDYIGWLEQFARIIREKLRDDGSFILDLGGAYRKGIPVRSLYNFRVLIRLCDEVGFFLAEDFYWFNSAKLPSPIEWVNKRKLRAKDSINTVWWFSKTEHPKADTSKVLTEYSDRMRKLLQAPESFYTPKKRPSGHDIGKSFGKNNGGAIPSNLLQIPNTESNGTYLSACKALDIKQHPARFPAKLPEFFIRFLTDPGDIVLDNFAGSNTTGYVAEKEGRKWIAFEERIDYLAASAFRFFSKEDATDKMLTTHNLISVGETVEIEKYASKSQSLISAFTGTNSKPFQR